MAEQKEVEKKEKEEQKITKLWARYGKLMALQEQHQIMAENTRRQATKVHQQIVDLSKQ